MKEYLVVEGTKDAAQVATLADDRTVCGLIASGDPRRSHAERTNQLHCPSPGPVMMIAVPVGSSESPTSSAPWRSAWLLNDIGGELPTLLSAIPRAISIISLWEAGRARYALNNLFSCSDRYILISSVIQDARRPAAQASRTESWLMILCLLHRD